MYCLCKLLRLQATDASQPAQRRASLHRRVFLCSLRLFSSLRPTLSNSFTQFRFPYSTRLPRPDPPSPRTRATMEQQTKAPQDIRNVVNYLRSSKAGMKIRVGVLNGKRIDYFKGTCHDHHLSVGLLSAVLGALQYTSRAVRPELLDRTRLIVLFVYL